MALNKELKPADKNNTITNIRIENVCYPVAEIKQLINNCRKLAQKEFKGRYDWLGMVIQWILSKKIKFDQIIFVLTRICPGKWNA